MKACPEQVLGRLVSMLLKPMALMVARALPIWSLLIGSTKVHGPVTEQSRAVLQISSLHRFRATFLPFNNNGKQPNAGDEAELVFSPTLTRTGPGL